MLQVVTGVVNAFGSVISGIFGAKQAQVDLLTSGMKVLSDVNASDAQRSQAVATVLTAEAQSPFWLTNNWRPLMMVFFGSLIGSRWFGYSPPNMTEEEILKLYQLLELGIGGYMGGRTLEKVVSLLKFGNALTEVLKKKLI